MQPSLKLLVETLEDAARQSLEAAQAENWIALMEASRRVLSAGSRLHSRAAVLVDLAADEKFVRDAFGELPGRAAPEDPRPIPGDRPLPLDPPPARGKPGSTSPRGRKG